MNKLLTFDNLMQNLNPFCDFIILTKFGDLSLKHLNKKF